MPDETRFAFRSDHKKSASQEGSLGRDEIESGHIFAPKFDSHGVLPAVATDAGTGEVLMLAYMNSEALALTIETGLAHYWSRSRRALWRKGETSGHQQHVVEILTDCDQDTIWLKVEMKGAAACHVGYRSCFYRAVPLGSHAGPDLRLEFKETEKLFDPKEVYPDEQP